MSSILVVATHEVRSAVRERLALALLVVFLGMALVSSFIGWATHHTVMSVYDQTVVQVGRHIPNPFAGASALDVTRNTIIYIVLIGALLATVVGVRSAVRDRKAGVTDLIFSRPVPARAFVLGKLLGVQAWMAIVLVAALLASWIGAWAVLGAPLSLSATASLTGFITVAWVFLLPFSVLGIVAGARSRHESTALLVPILSWVVIAFVIPQLGTAQNPSALLTPVPSAASTTDLFFKVNQALLQPVSVTEHFKHAGSVILRLRDIASPTIAGDLVSLGVVAALSLAALALVGRASMRRPLHE